jgi:hypothetical protein
MEEKKVTIDYLLTEDLSKLLAESLLNNQISEMLVIFRMDNNVYCHASSGVTANVVGLLEITKAMVLNDYLNPSFDDNDSYNDEDCV